jgi:hypothetical protein
MATIYSIGTLIVGMVLTNAITVLPYYLKHRHEYKRMAEIGSLISALCFLSLIIFHIIDFGSLSRLINCILNPAPNSIVRYTLFILIFSLVIQVLFLIAAYKEQQNAINILTIISTLWSIVVVSILLLVQRFFSSDSTISLIFGSLSFIFVLALGGQIILYCACKFLDVVTENKCSAVSLKKVRNQIAILFGLLVVSSTTNFILA